MGQLHTSDTTFAAAHGVGNHDGSFLRTGGAGTGAGRIIRNLSGVSGVLQTVQTGAVTAATVKLQGSVNGSNWTDIASNAHAGNDMKEAVFVDKGYAFFRVNKSVDAGAGDFVDYYLHIG